MLNITDWAWIFDNTYVVCRNVDNKVIVEIERTGNTRTGEIQDFPIELYGKISELHYGDAIIEELIISAADEFFSAYLGKP